MSFFIQKNESEADTFMSPDLLMKVAPDYYRERFEAIKDLRDSDDGTLHKGQGFRRVASFVNVPMLMAVRLSDPEFLNDKKKFYAFIDRNPQYVTYQRRNGGKGTAKDDLKMPLSALGIDYPGTVEDFEPVYEEANDPEPVVETTPIIATAEVTE